MKKLMMAMGAAGVILAARAETEIVDGVSWSYNVSYGKVTVTGASPCAGEMTIPETLGGCPVTEIGKSAFESKGEISKMILPSGLMSINGYAFRYCPSLTEINIPYGVTTIGSCAFEQCSSLQEIKLPDSVTTLGVETFYLCSALRSVLLSANLEVIPASCFKGCSKLSKIEIPVKVTRIDDAAFSSCSAATALSLSTGLKSVGSSAFFACRGLKTLSIPADAVVAENAFVDCSGLTKIDVAEGNTSVKVVDGCLVSSSGSALLAAPSGKEFIKVPEGIVTVPEYMFREARSLKYITLPSTLQSIGAAAFLNCVALMRVEFPAGLKSFARDIYTSTFAGCSSVGQFIFNGPPPANVDTAGVFTFGSLLYPREYGAEWQKVVTTAKFNGYVQPNHPAVEYVSVAVRKQDPTVLDVTYRVKSAKPTVKVRALAFQEGVRSFANVVRPTEFIEGTAANIGDAIPANAEHKLSWKVSADWKVDLTKFKFEVLAVEEDILPLELVKIPANGGNKSLEFSWNAITVSQVFDALLWLYADGDAGLTLEGGVLKQEGKILAKGLDVVTEVGDRYWKIADGRSGITTEYAGSNYEKYGSSPDYVFKKMGFSLLLGKTLDYVNDATRLGLSPVGARQYAWRELND